MENQYQTFELSEKNILEEFYELIEKHRLDNKNDFQLGDFYDFLNNFDLAYQKFNTKREGEVSVKYVEKWLNHSLYLFLVLFKFRGFSDRPLFYSFKRFIHWFSLVLDANQKLNSEFFFNKNITENFPAFVDSEYLRFLKRKTINFNLIRVEQFESYSRLFEKAEYEISEELGLMPDFQKDETKTKLMIYGDDFSVTDIQINDKNENFINLDTHYEMTIDINLNNNDDDGSILITSLSLIVNCISNIDNTKVKIEHIKTGSLYTRIRVYLKDLVAKEEVKAVLETSKEIVVKTISSGQVSYSETKKNLAETQKIKAETELIEKEIESKPSEFESKISNALDLERKALENEKLKIELTKEKLEVLNKLSDLAIKGILDVNDVRIDINEILYLIKTGDSIEAPESDIDKIT